MNGNVPTNCPNCGAPFTYQTNRLLCEYCYTQMWLGIHYGINESDISSDESIETPEIDSQNGLTDSSVSSFFENFSGINRGWLEKENLDVTYKYKKNAYHIITSRIPSSYKGVNKNFKPVIYESTVPKALLNPSKCHDISFRTEISPYITNPDCFFGLLIRNEQEPYCYLFGINQRYEHIMMKQDRHEWVILGDWKPMNFIDQTIEKPLSLLFEHLSDKLIFNINDEPVTEISDPELYNCKLGLFVGKYKYSAPYITHIIFKNIKVSNKPRKTDVGL